MNANLYDFSVFTAVRKFGDGLIVSFSKFSVSFKVKDDHRKVGGRSLDFSIKKLMFIDDISKASLLLSRYFEIEFLTPT